MVPIWLLYKNNFQNFVIKCIIKFHLNISTKVKNPIKKYVILRTNKTTNYITLL